MPASVPASEAGVAASAAGRHLARLVDAGLLVCRPLVATGIIVTS